MELELAKLETRHDGLATTRAEAKALGAARYHTGIPCKHGHIADRYTKSGSCVVCGGCAAEPPVVGKRSPTSGLLVRRIDARKAGEKLFDPETLCSKGHLSPRYTTNGNCVECGRKQSSDWRHENPERYKEVNSKWHKDNADYLRTWRKAHREKLKAQASHQ